MQLPILAVHRRIPRTHQQGLLLIIGIGAQKGAGFIAAEAGGVILLIACHFSLTLFSALTGFRTFLITFFASLELAFLLLLFVAALAVFTFLVLLLAEAFFT